MTTDFTTYQPPGVYIEEDTSSLVNVIGVRPTVVAIVGPSVGYRVHTEAVVLTGTTAAPLANLGIDIATIVVTAPDGTPYTLTDDYTVAQGTGADAQSGTVSDNPTTLTRVADGEISTGSTVYVTYRYTDTSFYNPLAVTDFETVKDAFGEPVNLDTGAVVSPLSFAAKIAMENGARRLVLVPTKGGSTSVTRTQLSDAMALLENNVDVNLIVPLPVGITGSQGAPGDTANVGVDLRAHVAKVALDGIYRVGILGHDKDVSVDPLTSAASYRSPRVVMAYPNRLHYYHGLTNVTVEVSGYYLAAAYAGRLASQPVQTPLTKKEVDGFAGFPADLLQTLTATRKNSLSEGGIAVTESNRQGRMVVRHGTTTDRTNVRTRELSLVRAKDALINLIYETVDSSGLVGGYIDEDTPDQITGVITGVLESAKQSDVIVDYNGLAIRQRTVDPSVMEVKFAYRPAYPLNYIVISFSIDTSTGEVSVLDEAA